MSWGPTSTTLGRYRLVQRLGEGGMGEVHLGLDPAGCAVAVKVLRPHIAHDPDARTRLRREVATLRRVRHPLVAEVLDADVDGERPYLVTRYVPGPSLDLVVRDHGAVPPQALRRLGAGLGEAVQAVHRVGIVHRDLKPGNVLVLDGDPVLIDFGIAHVADDIRITSTGLVMGTPGYLAPEVVAGDDVSEATDWWGWAAVLAFAATGRPPFGRGPMDVVLDRVRRGAADLGGLDPALTRLLAAALAVDPAARPCAGEVLAGLERVCAGPMSAPEVRSATPTVVLETDTARSPAAATMASTVPAALPPRPRVAPVSAPEQVPQVHAPAGYAPPPAQPGPYSPAGSYPPPGPLAGMEWAPPVATPPPWTGDSSYDVAEPPLPRVPRRPGTVLAVAVALVAVALARPDVAALLLALGVVLARTVDRSATYLLRRRSARGRTGTDGLLATLALPWHLLSSLVLSAATLVLPVLLGVSAAFVTGLVVGTAAGTDPLPGSLPAVGAGAVTLLLATWWGPGGGAVRRGTRRVARRVAPGRRSTAVLVCLLLLVAAGAAAAAVSAGGPSWQPLQGATPDPRVL